jgi:predicted dehydrogenase
MKLRLAVIGLGRWGPNHVRNFSSLPDAQVVAAADPVASTRARIAASFREVACVEDYRELLARDDVDAVVVATPTSTHRVIVSDALGAGKHVLCEKPLAASSADAWSLVAEAERAGRVLMTGHVFLFNGGIEFLARAAREQLAGSLYYLNAVRTNLGPFRYDVNAAWDLASHDVYIFNHLLQARPASVSAMGASYLNPPIEDIVFITLRYPNGVMGHIHVSWLDPKKVRTLTLVGEKKMITWDEFGVPGPVMIYDRTVAREPRYDTFGDFQLLAREGDVVVPRVMVQEPLAAQARAFVQRCLKGVDDGRGNARQGAEAVDVLAAAALSLREQGRQVEITYGG